MIERLGLDGIYRRRGDNPAISAGDQIPIPVLSDKTVSNVPVAQDAPMRTEVTPDFSGRKSGSIPGGKPESINGSIVRSHFGSIKKSLIL